MTGLCHHAGVLLLETRDINPKEGGSVPSSSSNLLKRNTEWDMAPDPTGERDSLSKAQEILRVHCTTAVINSSHISYFFATEQAIWYQIK